MKRAGEILGSVFASTWRPVLGVVSLGALLWGLELVSVPAALCVGGAAGTCYAFVWPHLRRTA